MIKATFTKAALRTTGFLRRAAFHQDTDELLYLQGQSAFRRRRRSQRSCGTSRDAALYLQREDPAPSLPGIERGLRGDRQPDLFRDEGALEPEHPQALQRSGRGFRYRFGWRIDALC